MPWWLTLTHMSFMAWTVLTAHYPVLFLGAFLIFLGLTRDVRVSKPHRAEGPAPRRFFPGRTGDSWRAAGLVDFAGVVQPVSNAAVLSSTLLTAFNDNALITYLATLVPNLDEHLKIAIVEGAVTGGGLTVIANAPNPAGQALLASFFDNSIKPIGLLLGALIPTIIVMLAFRLI